MKPLMTLAELQQVTPAFNSFATIDNCNIPDYYKDIFPKKCKCGAEMIMTRDDRTQLQCCNPCCWIKMAHRMNYFISFHGFKGFGEQACLSLFAACHDMLEYYSFLSAFSLTNTQLGTGLNDHQLSLFREIQGDLLNSAFHVSDAIASLGIPNVGSRSTLFEVVKSPLVFLQYMLQGRVNELCDIAGIQAASTRFYLSCFDIDVLLLMRDIMPNIMNTPKGEVFVAITGKVSVGGKDHTRTEFIALCESIRDTAGNQLYKLVETKAQDKLQFVIADGPSTSSKYTLGQQLGKLITADAFYNHLLAAVEDKQKATPSEGTESPMAKETTKEEESNGS